MIQIATCRYDLGPNVRSRRSPTVHRAGAALLIALAIAASGTWGRAATAQDLDKGERVFKKCQACHALEPGAHTDKGPSLHGLFGRRAGTAEGFAYSDAMKSADVVWSEETLEAFLADSQAVVPGNTMNFSSLRKPEDRTAVIAYLRDATQ